MAEFKCTQFECKYKQRSSLVNHLKSKHPSVEIETNVRGAGRSTGSIQYKCYHCGNDFSQRCNLDPHIKLMHGQSFNCTLCGKGCTRSINLEMHMRTWSSSSTPAHRGGATSCSFTQTASTLARRGGAASCSSTPAHRGGAAFVVQRKRKALGGAVEVHSVDMNAANQFVTLEDAVVALEPTMAAYQQRHHAYKYQIAVNIIFHKAVDPTILTDPPVTLRTTMVAVYAVDVPQLVETSCNILELLEVYEQNGSGWVFSNFVSMELTLWHLDPLRASAFVPLPKWIRDKRDVTNVVGTGDDCSKWAVLAGLHPAAGNPEKLKNYFPYANLYDFSNLNYPHEEVYARPTG